MEELMRVEGLKMYFGGLKAIDGFDLTINKGETLGIIGPNGAGKTTLFNAICGVYKPTDGKVFLEGKEVQGTPAHEMAKMGIARTFQISKPLRGLTIFDNVVAAAGVQEYTGIGSYFHKSHTKEVEDKVIRYRAIKQSTLDSQQKRCGNCGRKLSLGDAVLRRIDDENRIVYKEQDDAIIIASCKGHYDD